MTTKTYAALTIICLAAFAYLCTVDCTTATYFVGSIASATMAAVCFTRACYLGTR